MTCQGCKGGAELSFAVRTAFQPIFDVDTGKPYAYEALCRGPNGEGAGSVLQQVNAENRYAFDQACRVTAIRTAVKAGLLATDAKLSINFMPNAVYEPKACIRLTLQTAKEVGLPLHRLIFEFTENERLDTDHVAKIVHAYREFGFATALDDFGAGYAGLNLLANLHTDIVKLDMELIRGIESNDARRRIVMGLVKMLGDLGRTVVAEGIETEEEMATLRLLGVRYMQGYYLARPQLELLPRWFGEQTAACNAA